MADDTNEDIQDKIEDLYNQSLGFLGEQYNAWQDINTRTTDVMKNLDRLNLLYDPHDKSAANQQRFPGDPLFQHFDPKTGQVAVPNEANKSSTANQDGTAGNNPRLEAIDNLLASIAGKPSPALQKWIADMNSTYANAMQKSLGNDALTSTPGMLMDSSKLLTQAAAIDQNYQGNLNTALNAVNSIENILSGGNAQRLNASQIPLTMSQIPGAGIDRSGRFVGIPSQNPLFSALGGFPGTAFGGKLNDLINKIPWP